MTDPQQARGHARSIRALAIIPARLGSRRLPRKMLLRVGGRALFALTARNVIDSKACARVIVATDSEAILEEARREGLEARMTSADHPSGSDRVAEAWQALAAEGEAADVVVNVQGDEPELEPPDLRALVAAFGDPAVEAATLSAPLLDPREAALESIVKVVRDREGDALYFSRAAIPARGHSVEGSAPVHHRHVGVYAFRPAALIEFCALPRGDLERQECLEQLRWLEAGRKMRVVAGSRAPQGIDTMHDFEQLAARIRERDVAAQSTGARARDDAPDPDRGDRSSPDRGSPRASVEARARSQVRDG
jgi:3-deoxy-manno-octulosonate cytidylyltransferase (CMP-KDO synthetase)